jgi:hypothetical protein
MWRVMVQRGWDATTQFCDSRPQYVTDTPLPDPLNCGGNAIRHDQEFLQLHLQAASQDGSPLLRCQDGQTIRLGAFVFPVIDQLMTRSISRISNVHQEQV